MPMTWQVGDLLWENASWLYPLFLSYASLDGSVTSIDFNEWSKCMTARAAFS